MSNKKTPRPKDRADSEKRLIEAAKDVFSKHGYDGTSTRLIAEKANVNLALIARYFGNKHGLLVAVVNHEAKKFDLSPLSYPPQKSLLDESTKFVEARFRAHFEHIDLFRIVIVQLIVDKQFAKAIQRRDFLECPESITSRLSAHFKHKSLAERKKAAHALAEELKQLAFSGVVIQYLISGDPEEKCLKRLRESTKLLCTAFQS